MSARLAGGWLVGCCLLACVAARAAPAPAAGERPPGVPTRDAVVGYRLAPAAGEAIEVRVMLRAGGRALRVDLPDGSTVLAVPASRELTMVVPLERTAMALPWSEGPQPLFTVDRSKRFTRKGEATVADTRCTVWDAVGDKARDSVCVTADGVVLRHASVDPAGRRSVAEALIVRYEPLTDADFEVPAGFERLSGAP